jgi:hypothetical protein
MQLIITNVLSSSWRSNKTLFRRRNVDYDEDKELGGNTGVRVWYEDYTTIGIFTRPSRKYRILFAHCPLNLDWIHDSVKEHKRLARLRAKPGFKGSCLNLLDAVKGWVVVFLTGILVFRNTLFTNPPQRCNKRMLSRGH